MTLCILGIESTCDETAAAVVCVESQSLGGADKPKPARILSNIIADQAGLHDAFGGVVPEIAARAHAERVDICVKSALARANRTLNSMDAIAVSAGPGLIGGLLSGIMCAKGLAIGADLPLIGVNHLAGHALTPRMTDGVEYPYLMVLISGGHCQFLAVLGAEHFIRLGTTIDDAPGEAFDKVAKLLGLGYPGGMLVEQTARLGDRTRFDFPLPMARAEGCDMSFSGLKTALRFARDKVVVDNNGLLANDRADLCASFQWAVARILAIKTAKAMAMFRTVCADLNVAIPTPVIAVAGGVGANLCIREALQEVADKAGFAFIAPPLQYCTDNAAMIAWAGGEQFAGGRVDGMGLVARPRWPLDIMATPKLGSGKRGAKV